MSGKSSQSSARSGQFEGKVALITGSSGRVGRAIAERLARDGAFVIINGRKHTPVKETVEYFRTKGYKCDGLVADVRKPEDRQNLVQFTAAVGGGIDMFIHNARADLDNASIIETPESLWDDAINVNLKAAFMMTKLVVPFMEARGGGSIIYISTVLTVSPVDYEVFGAFTVSKAGLLSLCKTAGNNLIDRNIRVNCVLPGMTEGEFDERAKIPDKLMDLFNKVCPMHRKGKPEEVANLVAFLCSSDASYITSENFEVSGGFSRL